MPKKKNNFIPIPANESESPSWFAVLITLLMQLYPVAALLAFLRLRKMWRNHKLDNYRKYQRVIGSNSSISIKTLSKTIGVSKDNVRAVLSEMISKGYLGIEAYIDYSEDMLYITLEAAEENSSEENKEFTFDFSGVSSSLSEIIAGITGIAGDVADTLKNGFKSKNTPTGHRYAPSGQSGDEDEKSTESAGPEAAPEPAEQSAPVEAAPADMTESEATLARLRQLNDDILDEDVSRKIDRIGLLTGDIYAFVALNPERAGEVRKFMNYYLPTTMKLLTSYSMLERQSYQGDNIINARRDIEKILDTLVHAFEKQLDQLFATDAVDISSDISVLETMMAKDGLSEKTKGIKLQI